MLDSNDTIKTSEDVFGVIKSVPHDTGNLQGFVPTISAVPTYTPTRFIDQFRIYYVSGANGYLYVYDNKNNSWKSATLS